MPAIELAAAAQFATDPELAQLDLSGTRPVSDLRRYISKGHCLVAEIDGEIAGFLVNEPCKRELHIWELGVHPEFQRRGIGAGLIRACQIDAHNSGFQALTLTTFTGVPWNAPFYARLGFVEIGDLASHPRLANELEAEVGLGLPAHRRCAMIHFLGQDG
ncbi:MAG: N-acetyltransferase [Sphingomonadales bacterium]|nr:MAG: N-acetyltransferase [Sphingomonadales bacterium]